MAIQSVSDLVVALGGTVKVADIVGTSPQQVSNMRSEDRIPRKHYLALSKACAAARVDLPEVLFREAAA
jgi:hypothetical protein